MGDAAAVETIVTLDEQVRQGEVARQAIVDAMLGLYHRGVLDPTAHQIADQAGISLRSVYYHFADRESLAVEAVRRQRTQLEPLLEPPVTTGSLDDRIGDLVARRSELFEVVTPIRRGALLLRHRSATIADNLTALSRLLRAQVAATFAHELTADVGRDQTACSELLSALDMITSWEAWERLRTSQGLTRDRARGVMHRSLAALLGGSPNS